MAYNDKIIIQSSTGARDAYGHIVRTWATYKTVFAEIIDAGGSITYEAEQPVFRDNKTFKFRTADAPAVKTFPAQRISYNSEYYIISGVEKEGRLFTTLTAESYDDE